VTGIERSGGELFNRERRALAQPLRLEAVGLRVKLAQHPERFGALLPSTGERPIVEQSRRDPFWGAKVVDDTTLAGQDVLGRLLSELRDELRAGGVARFAAVEAPDSPDFLLYGRPIGTIRR